MRSITLDDLENLISLSISLRNALLGERVQEVLDGRDSLIRVMKRCLQRYDDLPDDELDRYLDAVLQAAGSALRHYTMQKSLDDMRAAMRAAMLPLPLFDSQCRELCAALGWCGGTYHQVLAEVKRLKAAEASGAAEYARGLAEGAARAGLTPAEHHVLLERRRQISVEGWTPEHDDEHVNDEIAALACFYAMPPGARDWPAEGTGYGATFGAAILPHGWKVSVGARRRELVKAGALILAEIERQDRAKQKGGV